MVDSGTAQNTFRSSERQFIRGLYLVICLIVAIAAASFHRIALFQKDGQWIAHAHEVRNTLDALLSAAITAETASRGYSLTGDETFLEPYAAAEQKIGPQLEQLKALVSDNPLQSHRAGKLSALIARQMEQIRLIIDLKDGQKSTTAASENAKHAYDAVRRMSEEMQDAEMALLQQKQDESAHASGITLAVAVLGTFLSIGITGIAAMMISRYFASNRRAHAILRKTNALLDQRIAKRAAALQKAHARLQLTHAAFKNVQESVVITTLDCRIVAVNPAFTAVTEYSRDEVIGKHMRILQSGRQDHTFYEQMWRSLLATGAWQGEIWNRRRYGEIYQEWLSIRTIKDAEGQPIYYIGISVDLNRINHAKTHLEQLAHHDQLTGLPNRLLLQLRLRHTIERATRNDAMCAVLFLDLDHFKPVNDTLGHVAGDELLKLASARMRERLRDIDTLARIGGDEFVIVLEEVYSHENAAAIAHALIKQLSNPFMLSGGQQVNISASIGISTYPYDATHPDELLERADTALYAAKQAGRGTWHFATPPQEPAGLDHAHASKPNLH